MAEWNNHGAAGGPLSRLSSLSLVTPSAIGGYSAFFRQNSNRECGWMYIKSGIKANWEKRWFVFDNGVLAHASSSTASSFDFVNIPMSTVITLRADKMKMETGQEPTIIITTTENKVFLKLANMDEMRKWLFCFQKSVALVLTHLMDNHGSGNGSGYGSGNGNGNDNGFRGGSGKNNNNIHGESLLEQQSLDFMTLESRDGAFSRRYERSANNRSSRHSDDTQEGSAWLLKQRLPQDAANANWQDADIWTRELGHGAADLSQGTRRNSSYLASTFSAASVMPFTAADVHDFVDTDHRSTVQLNRMHLHGERSSCKANSEPGNPQRYSPEGGTGGDRRGRSGFGDSESENDDEDNEDDDDATWRDVGEPTEHSIPINDRSGGRIKSSSNSNSSGAGSLGDIDGIAKSPYIPIQFINISEYERPMLATSYKDPALYNLEKVVQKISLLDQDDDVIGGGGSGSGGGNSSSGKGWLGVEGADEEDQKDDEYMLFDLDEKHGADDDETDHQTGDTTRSDHDNTLDSDSQLSKGVSCCSVSSEPGGDYHNNKHTNNSSKISSGAEQQQSATSSEAGSGDGAVGTGALVESPTDCWASPVGSAGNSLEGDSPIHSRGAASAAASTTSGIGAPGSSSSGNISTNSGNNSGNNSNMSSGANSRRGSRNDTASRSNLSNLYWRPGHYSHQGPRSKNEDRFVSIPNIEAQAHITDSVNLGGGKGDAIGYFAVFDGHSGDAAACYLQDNLLDNIRAHPLFPADLEAAIEEACVQTDRDFLELCKQESMYCGTTALGAFLLGSRLVVFNIGDCQAVLCSGGTAVEMSAPHKPGVPAETRRVEAANGWVTEEKELYMGRLHRMADHLDDPLVLSRAQQVNWVTIHRVCGELAVSRSIGDPDYKSFRPGDPVEAYFMWPDGHPQVFNADLVIPNPDCVSRELNPSDEFLVLASDGLWDVLSTAEVVQMTRQALSEDKTPSEASEELCSLACKLGSSDNVTVVIVQLQHRSRASLHMQSSMANVNANS